MPIGLRVVVHDNGLLYLTPVEYWLPVTGHQSVDMKQILH